MAPPATAPITRERRTLTTFAADCEWTSPPNSMTRSSTNSTRALAKNPRTTIAATFGERRGGLWFTRDSFRPSSESIARYLPELIFSVDRARRRRRPRGRRRRPGLRSPAHHRGRNGDHHRERHRQPDLPEFE